MITIDQKKCIKCLKCEKECPSMAISIDTFTVRHNCISCGHCVAVCPKQAVMYNSTPVRKLKPNSVNSKDLLDLYKNNRSVRFYSDRPVPEKIIMQLMDAVKFYPSASNRRKTSITVITDPAKIRQLNDMVSNGLISQLKNLSIPIINSMLGIFMGRKTARLIKSYHSYFIVKREKVANYITFGAPVIILFHSKPAPLSGDAEDSAIWAANTSNLALASGLGASFIGYIPQVLNGGKFRKKKSLFGVPESHKIHSVLAVGYPAVKYVNEIERMETVYKII